jgi:uncharacterized protein YjgD (DUF1641 family)
MLLKLLANPEMAALLKLLAKNLSGLGKAIFL